MIEEDMWELRENLGNMKDLVKEFEEEYGEIRRVKKKNRKENKKGELLDRYMAKMLYRWDDKRFDEEYWGRLERNWNKWKGKGTINKGKEEEKDKEGRIEEWDEEDEMGKIGDPYNKLQEIFGTKILKRGVLS